LKSDEANKWKPTCDNKETGTKTWTCSDVSSLSLKTIKEKFDSLNKVEVVWRDINFDKLMAITKDFGELMKRMQNENTGIVIEEMKILQKFPDNYDEFNKCIF